MTRTDDSVAGHMVDAALTLATQFCACPPRAPHVIATLGYLRKEVGTYLASARASTSIDDAVVRTTNAVLDLSGKASDYLRDLQVAEGPRNRHGQA